jgi:predicted DNA-binding transcriptional regulator AlpA
MFHDPPKPGQPDPPVSPPASPTSSLQLQPLGVLWIDGALLTLATVMALCGMSKAAVYRAMDAGDFPRPVLLREGGRSKRWRSEEIRAWLMARGLLKPNQ